MNRINRSKKTANIMSAMRQEWPIIVFFWMIGMGFLSYVIMRIALDGYPHPYHWASGLAGAITGFVIGWIWYFIRGDIL